jgi:hypothetical protein
MSNLWEGLLAALVVAAISGITFIAYKHPTGYKRLYIPLIVIVIVTQTLCVAFDLGKISGFSDTLIQFYSRNPKLSFQSPERPPSPVWVYIAPPAIVIYLLFLNILPILLVDDRQKKPTQDTTDTKPPGPEEAEGKLSDSKRKRKAPSSPGPD